MTRLLAVLPFLLASTAAFAGAGGGSATGDPIDLPEPASIALLAAGVGAVMLFRNRRK